jgi:hypothetical protein
MSEARKRILSMLAEGKITVEQSEELLSALDRDEKAGRAAGEPPEADSTGGPGSGPEPTRKSPFGVNFGEFAHTIQNTVREAMKKVEPPSRELKARLKEFGGWMQDVVGTMATEFSQYRGEPVDGVQVDFQVPAPEGFDRCRVCLIENLFGSVTVKEGPEFGLKVQGRLSRAALEGQPPNLWFISNAVKVEGDLLRLGIDRTAPAKSVLDLEITLPAGFAIRGKAVSADFRLSGAFKVEDIQTVSGSIHGKDVDLDNAVLESVSGTVRLEGGKGVARVSTTSGDFLLKQAHITGLKVQSVSGDLLVTECSGQEDAEIDLGSTSGDVTVEKFQSPWSRVEAYTRTGEIKVGWQGNTQPAARAGLSLASGQDGAAFKAETLSGDITFD